MKLLREIIEKVNKPHYQSGEITPKVGMKFKHRRILRPDNKPGADHVVTKIAQGVVYYKQPHEKKAKAYTPVSDFHKIVLKE